MTHWKPKRVSDAEKLAVAEELAERKLAVAAKLADDQLAIAAVAAAEKLAEAEALATETLEKAQEAAEARLLSAEKSGDGGKLEEIQALLDLSRVRHQLHSGMIGAFDALDVILARVDGGEDEQGEQKVADEPFHSPTHGPQRDELGRFLPWDDETPDEEE